MSPGFHFLRPLLDPRSLAAPFLDALRARIARALEIGTRELSLVRWHGIAGMILTKETYIIHIGCALIAAGVLWISHKLTPMTEVEAGAPAVGLR